VNILFGLYHLDGAPVGEKLQTMQQALASFVPGRTGIWDGGWLGLGCLHLPGTPEAKGEQLPVCDGETQSILTAGARLDNRDELLAELGIPAGRARSAVTDADIILQAYRRWGEDCVLHLDGDWHFALWDPRERSLFLARDQNGNTGLYYFQGPRGLAFASSKKALLALDDVPKEPNLLRVAQVLAAWAGDGTQTAYSQIERLPPAHRMVISPEGSRKDRFWFPENVSELRLKSDDEYVEAFLESFRRAVAVRLRCQSRVAVTLSGGLDSGSVTAVAAGLLRMRGDSLLAFTAMPLHDPKAYTDRRRFGDEAPLARQTASHAGNVEHHLLRSESITPLAGIERMLWVHDEPGHAAGNQFWITALLEAARQREVGVLLTGQMGNAVISWTGGGENLLPLLWHGKRPTQHEGGPGFWQAFEAARAGAGLGRWRAARRFPPEAAAPAVDDKNPAAVAAGPGCLAGLFRYPARFCAHNRLEPGHGGGEVSPCLCRSRPILAAPVHDPGWAEHPWSFLV
jgi:asparagine synthase (glutamine-hydrolysing)